MVKIVFLRGLNIAGAIMSKKLVITIIALFFAVLGVIYIKLGGLNEVEIQLENTPEYHIAGKYYAGRYKDQAVEEIYYEVKSMMDKGVLKGTLSIIYFKDPIEAQGDVENFIGILTTDDTTRIPKGYEWRTIPAGKAVRAKINAHNLVMPTPETINNKIDEFAQSENLSLSNISIEKYTSDNELIIEVPLSDNL